jgi:hypothetical protein
MQEILMNTHKFWWEIQQTKCHFWEERRVLPFVLHYYVQLYCEGDLEMHPIFFQLGWNLDGDWPIRRQNPYQHQFVNVNNNNYMCCAKMAGKEETPTCRKKTVTWTNERSSFLIQVSCMVYTIKKLEWRLGCKTCIVYTGLKDTSLTRSSIKEFIWSLKPGIHDASFASKSPFKFLEFKFFVIIYIHKLMLIMILSSDWSISIQVPSKLKKNRMHFYSIQGPW